MLATFPASLLAADNGGTINTKTWSGADELDTATLIVRPGIEDFNIPVGSLWKCFNKSENIRSIKADNVGPGQFSVHLVSQYGGMTFYFRVADKHALLVRADVVTQSGQASTSQWNELLVLIVSLVETSCGKSSLH